MVTKLCRLLLATLVVTSIVPAQASAQLIEPFDPFEIDLSDRKDEDKPPEELVADGAQLLMEERLLDARTKFLMALRKDPKNSRAHMMLASYYLVHVGHYRLALRYAKQAAALFLEQRGAPPYPSPRDRAQHAQTLYLLAQVRLNLDEYEAALKMLDEFSAHNYFDEWYPGTRAWVLMKLGRLDEAIKVAQLGYAVMKGSAERGHVLNMLGILFSMSHRREESLQIFKSAIALEMSQGTLGQPATPLNNAGEVYKEIFDEPKAESSWLKATSLPDGCEHVLPALNLALLYIEQINLQGAQKAMDNFESCIAQYPLRNGEEHRALVHLARGRIALWSGRPTEARQHLNEALERTQWFGKIGTNQDDLQAAAMTSLAAALSAESNILALEPVSSSAEWAGRLADRAVKRARAWWLNRRALQLLSSSGDLEDLYVRNTDSMLEYPTLGSLFAKLPQRTFARVLDREHQGDDRVEAARYYRAWEAERLVQNGDLRAGLPMIGELVNSMRRGRDDLLKLHLLAVEARVLGETNAGYSVATREVFRLNRAAVRNYGLRLPVGMISLDPELRRALAQSPFMLGEDENRHLLGGQRSGDGYSMRFLSPELGEITASGSNATEAVAALSNAVFSSDLGSSRSQGSKSKLRE